MGRVGNLIKKIAQKTPKGRDAVPVLEFTSSSSSSSRTLSMSSSSQPSSSSSLRLGSLLNKAKNMSIHRRREKGEDSSKGGVVYDSYLCIDRLSALKRVHTIASGSRSQTLNNRPREPMLKLSDDKDCTKEPLIRFCQFFNQAVCIEVADMFHAYECLDGKQFYKWLEGFFGLITAMIESFEEVVFAWLREVGCSRVQEAVAVCDARRKLKQQRMTREYWYILDNKQLDVSLVEQLALMVLHYFHAQSLALPAVLHAALTLDERLTFEGSLIEHMCQSQAGVFALCAVIRALLMSTSPTGSEAGNSLDSLTSSFPSTSTPSSVEPFMTQFHELHTDLLMCGRSEHQAMMAIMQVAANSESVSCCLSAIGRAFETMAAL